MAKFNDTEGVWIAYDLEGVYEVRLYSEDPVEVIAYVSNRGCGQIAFWPAGFVIDDGVKWWQDHAVDYETQEEKLKRIEKGELNVDAFKEVDLSTGNPS